MSEGWIKLHRKLLRSAMWKQLTSVQRDLMINLLLLASHKHNQWEWNGQIFRVQPGQFITSLEKLREKMGKNTSIKQVRTALQKLKKWEFVAEETASTGRLITIINWETYQGIMNEEGQSKGQTRGKRGATIKKGENVLRKEGASEIEKPGQTLKSNSSAREEIERVRKRMEDYGDMG